MKPISLRTLAASTAVILAFAPLAACSAPTPTSAAQPGSVVAGPQPALQSDRTLSGNPQTTITGSGISVNGVGVVYATPDMATVQVGVQTRSSDPRQAVNSANEQMTAIAAALQSMGIEAKDIQTANFSLNATQDYDPMTGQNKGTYTYQVDNTLNVIVRDLNKLGDVLGQAASAGANSIYGVTFGFSNINELEAQARAAAVADAKARAEQLAQASGITLGTPLSLNESTYTSPSPMQMSGGRVAMADSVSNVPVFAGQGQITVYVSAVYGIR